MELQYRIALTLAPQVGAITAKTLFSYCGSAEAVFRSSRKSIVKIPGIGPTVADSIATPGLLEQAEQEMLFLEKHDVSPLFYTDAAYPTRLRQCYDCPAMLYFSGSDIQLLNAERILAIVGTRQPSDYGRQICESLVEAIAPYQVVIVSGLAFGIDISAHRKATALGIPNIGVLGHGLGSIYPSEHRSSARRMQEHGGLLSEYISSEKPDREHFPMRNRIIAGMCDALLVVETAASGGSMISAALAHQYGRDIAAVPGRAGDPKSAGCNMLIKSQRAQLVESAEDIAALLNWEPAGQKKPKQGQLFQELSTQENRTMTVIRENPEIAIDRLTVETGIPAGELAAAILQLEFMGLIRTLPGKRYVVV